MEINYFQYLHKSLHSDIYKGVYFRNEEKWCFLGAVFLSGNYMFNIKILMKQLW